VFVSIELVEPPPLPQFKMGDVAAAAAAAAARVASIQAPAARRESDKSTERQASSERYHERA